MSTRAVILGLLATLAWLSPARGWSKEYFVNKGVKYHLGDNRAALSTDSAFLQTYPVVGQEWIQAFTVDRPDVVHVRIDKIWGVDDCPYCKIIVTINRHDLGRIFSENNRNPFTTPDPLAVRVEPGVTYYLKVASYGGIGGSADDFVMQDVVVETNEAAVKFLEPGPIIKMPDEAMPTVQAPRKTVVTGTCRGTRALSPWLPAEAASQGVLRLSSLEQFSETRLGSDLAKDDYFEAQLRVRKVEAGNLVGQAFEVMLGPDAGDGWALMFAPGEDRLLLINLKRKGAYRAKRFDSSAYKPGQWNSLRVARCADGRASLYLNGRQVGDAISDPGADSPPILRVRQLSLDLADRAF